MLNRLPNVVLLDIAIFFKRMLPLYILKRIRVLAGASAAVASILSLRDSCGAGSNDVKSSLPFASSFQGNFETARHAKLDSRYRFVVPSLPTSSTWDYRRGTVYQWGDVDFDSYGSRGTYKLSDYSYRLSRSWFSVVC